MAGPEINYISVCSGIEAASVAMSRIEGVRWNPVAFSEIDPFPCAVLAHRFPGVPNLGDLTKIRYDKEKDELTNGTATIPLRGRRIHAILGGTPCFVAGTMVLTPKGYAPIETLRVGDEVVGGSGAIRKVEAVGSKMAEVGKFSVLGRPPIVCTANHPFFCVKMKRDERRKSPTYANKIPVGGYEKTRADKAKGLYIGRIAQNAEYPLYALPKCQNAEWADVLELAGWYLGDGYIRRFTGKSKKTVVFALCSEQKIARFRERFSGIVNFSVGKDGKVSVNCTALANWLSDEFGETAPNKRIPYWCYAQEVSSRILDGYLATDGCRVSGRKKIVTVSPALAYGVADLWGDAFVHLCHVPTKGTICGRIVNQRDWYSVAKADNGGIRTKLVNGRYASIVRSYESTGTVQRVYNITVSDEHTYIANGLYTHNCQDLSIAGKRAGAEKGSGTRSSLFYEYARLVGEVRPDWLLFENVPGILSSRGGRDFYAVLCTLVNIGYGVAYRVLDAQYVRTHTFPRAVPQRRRRVWLVGCLGTDETVPAQILFERKGLCGDTPPRREAGKGFAAPSGYCSSGHDRVVGGTGFYESGPGWYSEGVGPQRVGGGSGQGAGNLVACGTGPDRPGDAGGGRGRDCGGGQGTGGGIGFDLQAFGKYGEDGSGSTVKARDWKDATDLAVAPLVGDVAPTLDASYYKGQGSRQGEERAFAVQPSGALNPDHPQTHRVHGAGGVWPTLSSGRTSGQDQAAVLTSFAPTPSASFDGNDVSATLHKPNGSPGFSDQEVFAQRGAYLASVPTPEEGVTQP